MSDAATKYNALEERLIADRARGALSDSDDDQITEEMADLWYEMTRVECAEANARAEKFATASLLGGCTSGCS
mgnify:CR=1 FL=1